MLQILNALVDLLPILMAVLAFTMGTTQSRLAGAGGRKLRQGAFVFGAAAIISFLYNSGWQLVRTMGLRDEWILQTFFSMMSVVADSLLPIVGMVLLIKAAVLSASGPNTASPPAQPLAPAAPFPPAPQAAPPAPQPVGFVTPPPNTPAW